MFLGGCVFQQTKLSEDESWAERYIRYSQAPVAFSKAVGTIDDCINPGASINPPIGIFPISSQQVEYHGFCDDFSSSEKLIYMNQCAVGKSIGSLGFSSCTALIFENPSLVGMAHISPGDVSYCYPRLNSGGTPKVEGRNLVSKLFHNYLEAVGTGGIGDTRVYIVTCHCIARDSLMPMTNPIAPLYGSLQELGFKTENIFVIADSDAYGFNIVAEPSNIRIYWSAGGSTYTLREKEAYDIRPFYQILEQIGE